MPKKARSKQVGSFKIEDKSLKVVKAANGHSIALEMNPLKPESVKVAKILHGGIEYQIPADVLVQAGMVLQAIDKNKRFVCANHGTYESMNGTMQKPTCPSCHKAIVSASERMIDTSGTFEEDDA